MAVALLNTEALQRLGRVYQLGYAHLVYRGGTHTRLSHVMGATHTAAKIVDNLRQNYSQKQQFWPVGARSPEEFLPYPSLDLDARWEFVRHVCAWSALLHDVGHIPLGHTLEDEFEKLYSKHDDFRSERLTHLWSDTKGGTPAEIRSVLLNPALYPDSFSALGVRPEEVFGAVLLSCLHKESPDAKGAKSTFGQVIEGLDDAAVIHRLLKKAWVDTQERNVFAPYMADIVGDTICADYLDYLRRDPMNVGLDVLRDDRVISRFYVGKEEADHQRLYRMALSLVDRSGHDRLDTCTGVVDLVRQRFRFAEIIYYHKTKVAASAMFAKGIKLIGMPREVGRRKATLDISDVRRIRDELCAQPEKTARLKQQMLPRDLMDPEIGDESLHLMMQYRAWEEIEQAVADGDEDRIERCLRGLAFLQAISRRQLYKTCFVLTADSIAALMPGAAAETVDKRIARVLHALRDEGKRDGNDFRTRLESELTAAAEWPNDAVILYVPSRKSQAKGIETYALQENTVVTLEKHPAVQAKVAELNQDYKKLWRLILLINPDRKYVNDAVGLSKALDVLIRHIITIAENHSSLIGPRNWAKELAKACWLRYVNPEQRVASEVFSHLSVSSPPKWTSFDLVEEAFARRGLSCASLHHAGLALICDSIVDFPISYAVGLMADGSDIARRIEAALVNWSVREQPEERDARRERILAIGREIVDQFAVNASDKVVPIRRDAGAAQPAGSSADLDLDRSTQALPLAARGVPTDRTGADATPTVSPKSERLSESAVQIEKISDEKVFEECTELSKGTKTWRGRFETLKMFFARDNLGPMYALRAFIEFAEREAAKKGRTYIYDIDELRTLFARFNRESG